MRKLKHLLIAALLFGTPLAFAGRGALYNNTLSATGADIGISVNVNGASSVVLQYTAVVTPATLSIKLQSSIIGDFSDALDCGSASTVVSSGTITCSGVFSKVRANITTLTGASASINYTLSTIYTDTGALTGTLATQIQGTAAVNSASVGNPVFIGGRDASGNMQPIAVSTGVGTLAMGQAIAGADGFTNASMARVVTDAGNASGMWGVLPLVYNGGSWDRARAASIANDPVSSTLTSRNSIGTTLVEFGSRWAVTHAPAAGTQASASLALEAASRHVITGVCFSAGSVAAPAATSLQLNIRDGASGAGTVLATFELAINAAAGENIQPVCVNGLNLVGTTGTAATAEFNAGLANLKESVTIMGYNVN